MVESRLVRINARSTLAFALLVVLAVSACSLLTSYQGLEGSGRPLDAMAPDVAPEAAPADTCRSAHVPPRPAESSDNSSEGVLLAAINSLSLVHSDAAAPSFGLDLDHHCTCPGPPSCVSRVDAASCDGDGGVDNATENLFRALLNSGVAVDDNSVREGISAGLYGIVFRLVGYSGAPDDPHVRFELLNAVSVNDGGRPSFDGNDSWLLDEQTYHLDLSAFNDLDAYVAGGVLVASIPKLVPKLLLPYLPGRPALVDLEIDEAVVVAKVSRTSSGGLVLSEGQVVGRASTPSWLLQIQRTGRCADDPSFGSAQALICAYRDIARRSADDDKGRPCESISFAIGFEASPARIDADAGARVTSPSACEADGAVLDATVGCPGE